MSSPRNGHNVDIEASKHSPPISDATAVLDGTNSLASMSTPPGAYHDATHSMSITADPPIVVGTTPKIKSGSIIRPRLDTSLNSLTMNKGHGISLRSVEVAKKKSLLSYTTTQLLVLVAVAYGNFWVAACVSLQAPFFPAEAEAKGATATVYGFVFGIYELVICFTSPLFGKLVSHVSPNFLVQSGLFVCGCSTVLFGLLDQMAPGATFISFAFAVRIFEGVGAAAFMTSSYTIMAAEFPERVATTFALLETCFGLGLILGPTVGGALYQFGGYFLPFLVLGTFLLLGSLVTWLALPAAIAPPPGQKSGNMLAFMSDFGTILDALAIATSLNFIGFNAATLEPHLRQFNLSPVMTGSVFVLTGAVYAITSPIWGKLCDLGCDEKLLCLIGAVLVVIGTMAIGPLPWLDMDAYLWLVIVALLIIGFGLSMKLVSSFVDAITQAIKRRGFPDDTSTYGMVSAMFFSSCSIGAFVGPTAGGYLLEHYGYRQATVYLLVTDLVMVVLMVIYKSMASFEKLGVVITADPERFNQARSSINSMDNEREPILKRGRLSSISIAI